MEQSLITLARNRGQNVNQISPAGISFLSKQLDADFRFIGCCNGLWGLLLPGDKNCKFVLANPTTHELKYLPPLNVRDSCGESSCSISRCSVSFDITPFCALGFDNENRDLKLLTLVGFSYYDDADDGIPKDFGNDSRHLTTFKKFIYSLKANEWREFEEIDCPWKWLNVRDMAVSCNNVCYWKLSPWDEDDQPGIGLFDFCAEKFSLMHYPPDNYDRVIINFSVIDLLGSVSVVTYLKYAGTKFFRFWVCGEDSGTWKRKPKYDVLLYGVESPLGVTSHPHFGLSCWFVGFVGLDERLVRYDYATKKTQTLSQFCDFRMTLFPHVVNTLNLDGVDGFYGMFNNDDDNAVHKRALEQLEFVPRKSSLSPPIPSASRRPLSPPIMSVFMRRLLSDSPERYCLSRVSCAVGEESLKVTDFGIPSPLQMSKFNIVGYCKGLLCLQYDSCIMILNVANWTYQQVPYPTISPVLGCPFEYCDNSCKLHTSCIRHTSIFVCGFGQDVETNEIKVVAQVITYFDAGGTYDGIFKQAYVYSLGKKDLGWTQFRFPQCTCFAGVVGYGAWVKGCLYWTCREATIKENGFTCPIWSIIKLDLNTLKFSSFEIPEKVNFITRPSLVVMELKDSLGLIVFSKDFPNSVHTWLFCEDSCEWVLKHSILGRSFFDVKCGKALGYLNDIMVFEGLDGSHVLMYDCALNKFWKSELIRDLPGCMQLFPFFESSVKLETSYCGFETSGTSSFGFKSSQDLQDFQDFLFYKRPQDMRIKRRTEPYTDEEIKSAFRTKAMKFHPDQNQDNKEYAETKFKEVMVSYEAIKSERKNNGTNRRL